METELFNALPNFGQWLRELSLGGSDPLAWGILLALTALPALGLLWRGRSWWDLLLLAAAGEIFAGLYFLVNPTLIASPLSGIAGLTQPMTYWWGVAVVSTLLSTLLAWAVLRWLERAGQITAPGRTLERLLKWAGWLLRVWVVGSCILKFVSWDLAGSIRANGGGGEALLPTFFIMLLVWAAELIPDLMFCQLLIRSGSFAGQLEAAPFAEETLAAAEKLRSGSERVLAATVLFRFLRNLLQVLAMPVLYNMHLGTSIPVGQLLLALALSLLCRYFRRAKAVSDDNESII